MIVLGLLLLQVGLTPPDLITVRSASASRAVPVIRSADGAAVSASALAAAMGGQASTGVDGRTTLAVAGVTVVLTDGSPFVTIDGALMPLGVAPSRSAGGMLVPLQVVADLLPHAAVGLSYDRRTAELRGAASTAAPMVAVANTTSQAPAASPAARREPPQRGTMVAGSAGDAVGNPAAMQDIRRSRDDPPAPARPSAEQVAVRRASSADDAGGPARPASARKYTVVIDPGHGGPDAGMSGPLGTGGRRLYEKDITLAVGKAVSAVLQERGYGTLLTRTRDTLIALSDRGTIANRQKGDLFLSIHVNAANPGWRNSRSARGFETYFLAEAKTEDARRVEQMENDVVRFEVETPVARNDPLSFIVKDMQQNEHLRESSDLAATVQKHLAKIHPGPNRGVKQAGFRVLVTAHMPAVLIEIGFGTNAAEAAWMADRSAQAKLAEAIADAAEEYFAHFERRTNTIRP